jgi:hypothetical protein
MTFPADGFDEQWAASVRRSEGTPDWNEMTLDQQKAASSLIRELASASPTSSRRAG